jgi:hypothetical protein
MAKKNYRVMFGDHMVPNPDYNPDVHEPKSKYLSVPAGSVVAIEEERAVAFTKVLPGTPGGPKLVETTDQPRVEAFGKSPSTGTQGSEPLIVPKAAPKVPQPPA